MRGRKPQPLPPEEAGRRVAGLQADWKLMDGRLTRTLHFPSYMDGIRFVNEVAGAAERMDHHPDLVISYREVSVSLWSHDAGGITERDFELAGRIDALAPPA